MKKVIISLFIATALMFVGACSSENVIPKPGDEDFIGPLSEDQIEELNRN